MTEIINAKVVNHHALEKDWQNIDYIPEVGEIVFYDAEIDENGQPDVSKAPEGREPIAYTRQKNGDGVHNVKDLPFASVEGGNAPIQIIQSDWSVSNPRSAAYIKNKPTIPSIEGLATEKYVRDSMPKSLADLTDDAEHRTVTDTEKENWNTTTRLAGTEAGLVKSGGDVLIDKGEIHINFSSAKETITATAIIDGADGDEGTYVGSAELLNDPTFTKAKLVAKDITINKATAHEISITGSGDAYSSSDSALSYYTGSKKPQALPLSRVIGVNTEDFTINEFNFEPELVRFWRFLFDRRPTEDDYEPKDFSNRWEQLEPKETIVQEEKVKYTEIKPGIVIYHKLVDLNDPNRMPGMYIADNAIYFEVLRAPDAGDDCYFIVEIDHYDSIITAPSLELSPSGFKAKVSQEDGFTPIITYTKPSDINQFLNIEVELICKAEIGGSWNSGNAPYFNNLSTINLTPVAGKAIKPAKSEVYSLGTLNQKWDSVFANNFYGTATRALQDENGRSIQLTYAEKASLEGLIPFISKIGQVWRMNENIPPIVTQGYKKYVFDFTVDSQKFEAIWIHSSTGNYETYSNIYYLTNKFQEDSKTLVYSYVVEGGAVRDGWISESYRTILTADPISLGEFATRVDSEFKLSTQDQTLIGAINELYDTASNMSYPVVRQVIDETDGSTSWLDYAGRKLEGIGLAIVNATGSSVYNTLSFVNGATNVVEKVIGENAFTDAVQSITGFGMQLTNPLKDGLVSTIKAVLEKGSTMESYGEKKLVADENLLLQYRKADNSLGGITIGEIVQALKELGQLENK